MLNGRSRVTLLCGSGCQGAHAELLALGERIKAPMVHALRGKEHVEWDNPYDVGMTGLVGFSSGYYAMLDCDCLLMLGTDFPYRQFYPEVRGVRIAQVDLRPGAASAAALWSISVSSAMSGATHRGAAAAVAGPEDRRQRTWRQAPTARTMREGAQGTGPSWRRARRAAGLIHPPAGRPQALRRPGHG